LRDYLWCAASASAAFQNDETLLRIDSPMLAAHFEAEIDRLWRGAELGVTARLERKSLKQRRLCGSGQQRPEVLPVEPAAARLGLRRGRRLAQR